jgi:hypothetical protein
VKWTPSIGTEETERRFVLERRLAQCGGNNGRKK